MHVCVQVQVLLYIFFEKGGVPVGGGGQREGRPEAMGVYYESRFSFSKLTSGVSGPTKLVHFLAG